MSVLRGEEPLIISDRTIVFQHTNTDPKDPANTAGYNFGPSIAALPDGRVMAAWFSSPFEGAGSQRIMQAFSSDQGRTWGAATILQDFDGKADFDPALFVARKDTFLFFSSFDPGIDIFLRRSGDSARTWSEPVKINQPNHTTRSNGIRLSSGELLVPLHRRGTKGGGVLKSLDGGGTWRRFGAVANPAGQGGEPTLAESKSGGIHMLLRTKDGQLWRSISHDKGETWSETAKTGLSSTSSASHLLRTRSGTLVLTYNPGPDPLRFPLIIRTSRDDGTMWSDPTLLADRPAKVGGWSICYPTLTELANGTLIAIWAQKKDSPGESYSDIHTARITLPK
ncbi:MAG: exo-alpha-sialidase [Prosthecobacter sp.]|jgi:predicted neuraminidase|uniref:sialidase family protein n=1 Tax=Prosthecobacter sp. TaxID=1965333 RepID=UPI0019DAE6AC|nr:sialidase family protein [Prosthecobacter sp.]MBE2284810.1 exo-alpha-sialidase [Prosthecobacter sp.]